METQTIVLGNQSLSETKAITFDKVLDSSCEEFNSSYSSPRNWEFLELIARKKNYDIICAYDTNKRNYGCLYLDHWNSGHV